MDVIQNNCSVLHDFPDDGDRIDTLCANMLQGLFLALWVGQAGRYERFRDAGERPHPWSTFIYGGTALLHRNMDNDNILSMSTRRHRRSGQNQKKLFEIMDFAAEEIEELNAYGPYNHAVWRGRGVTITHEESLTGRAEFLSALVRRVLVQSFTAEEMSKLTIADIGCYDGWLLEQLADLPFRRMVGIEPRGRNLEKGNKVRWILEISSRVEYQVGSIESLGQETFDVVICTGLLHHVESVGDALRKLRSICRCKLILETMCLSSNHITADFVRDLEPKDVVYFGKVPTVGLSGHKFESSFYHGSAICPAIVAVPTLSTLQMFMAHVGFVNIEVLVAPSSYWSGVVKRPGKACCLVADPGPITNAISQAEQILNYERGVVGTLLPATLVSELYERFCRNSSAPNVSFGGRLVKAYVSGPGWLSRILLRLIRHIWKKPFEAEIIKNIRYAPADKIALEMAKVRLAAGNFASSVQVAKEITGRLNADWRATYRAFLLLTWAYRRLGDHAAGNRYQELCRISNPELPDALFNDALFESEDGLRP